MTLLFDHMLYHTEVLEHEQIVEIDTQIHQLQTLPYIVRQNILDLIVRIASAYKEEAETLQKEVDDLKEEVEVEKFRAEEEEARADKAEKHAYKEEKRAFKAIAEAKKAKAREKTLRKNVQKICHRQRCAKRLTESYKTKD